MFLQALLAFVECPGVVAFLIPLWMASGAKPVPGIAALVALGTGRRVPRWLGKPRPGPRLEDTP